MRWDNLFDDLESQLEHELTAEDIDLRAEEERLRLGRMSIRDRLAALHGAQPAGGDYSIRVMLADGLTLTVHPVALGKDWLSGDVLDESSSRRQSIVPLAAVGGVVLRPEQVEPSLTAANEATGPRELSARLSLAFVLRDLCRRRQGLDLELLTGTIHGTIDRVGRDHVDVAVHERGVPRRESEVRQHRIVPLAQLRYVRL
ncbi:MAG: hypothetical protein WED09_06335 [Homoserinimonas sp.]